MIDLVTKLRVFEEFLDCAGVALWHYDGELRLISTSHHQQDGLHEVFSSGDSKEKILNYCMNNSRPGFSADMSSLLWLAAPYRVNGILTDIYMIGPVFGSSVSEQALATALEKHRIGFDSRSVILELLKTVPTVPYVALMQYGVMLHRCLTGEILESSDIQIICEEKPVNINNSIEQEVNTRKGTYALEQELFQAVENGNVNYNHPAGLYQKKTGLLSRTSPLRHAKNEMVSAITLICRAALRGGMPEDTAYALSDYYIQTGEDLNNVAHVYQHIQDAFKVFTERVHKLKSNTGYSKEIKDCIGYLELHLGEKLNMVQLSDNMGYNKNYLSTKFGREVGMSISEYLTQLRMERAKIYLRSTDKPIQQISDELGFNSISYFSAQFRKATGQTPSEYRNRQ